MICRASVNCSVVADVPLRRSLSWASLKKLRLARLTSSLSSAVSTGLLAALLTISIAQSAHAQWATQWHAPVVVAPQPVFVHHPVTHVHRAPVVVYHPRRVYARHRPILGGTVVRTRPGHRQVIWSEPSLSNPVDTGVGDERFRALHGKPAIAAAPISPAGPLNRREELDRPSIVARRAGVSVRRLAPVRAPQD